MRSTSTIERLPGQYSNEQLDSRRPTDRCAGARTARTSGGPLTAASALGPLILVALLLSASPLAAEQIPVRFVEGAMHGFLVLRTPDGGLLASGDLLQTTRAGGDIQARMVFRFADGSLFDETVVYAEQAVFAMRSYSLVQRGPAFPDDTEISLDGASGKYRVTTKARSNGHIDVLEGTLELPPDVYNGMLLTVAKNLPTGASETVHLVAFTPAPRIIQLQIAPAGEQAVLVGVLKKTAVHYVFTPKLGSGVTFFAKMLGRMPPPVHVWIVPDDVPAFVRFDGALFTPGPVWRIELTSPRWFDAPE